MVRVAGRSTMARAARAALISAATISMRRRRPARCLSICPRCPALSCPSARRRPVHPALSHRHRCRFFCTLIDYNAPRLNLDNCIAGSSSTSTFRRTTPQSSLLIPVMRRARPHKSEIIARSVREHSRATLVYVISGYVEMTSSL